MATPIGKSSGCINFRMANLINFMKLYVSISWPSYFHFVGFILQNVTHFFQHSQTYMINF